MKSIVYFRTLKFNYQYFLALRSAQEGPPSHNLPLAMALSMSFPPKMKFLDETLIAHTIRSTIMIDESST